MSDAVTMGKCAYCDEFFFASNPHLVPCVVVDGVREPLCRRCVEWANPLFGANGLPEIEILPGAYEPE